MADARNEFEPGDRFQIGSNRADQLLVKVISRSSADDYWERELAHLRDSALRRRL
jgi:hypothetical protein